MPTGISQLIHNFHWVLGNSPFEMILNGAVLTVIGYFAWRWVLEPVWTTLAGMWNFWKLRKSQGASLEITPPKMSEKSPLATQQLFTIMQRLLGKHGVMSLELVSSKREGIRYVVQTHHGHIPVLQKHVAAYLPEARFRVLDASPIVENDPAEQYVRVYELKQTRHYAYPLQPQEELNKSDPVAYIAGAMTKLEDNELVALQMVVSPHYSYWAARLYNKIHNTGYAIIDGKLRHFIVSNWWIWVVGLLYGGISSDPKAGGALAILLLMTVYVIRFFRPAEVNVTASEQRLMEAVLDKLGQPLFRTDIRVLVVADTGKQLHDLSLGMQSSLAPLTVSGFQGLYVPRMYPDWLGQKIGMFKLRHHMPSFLVFGSNVLAASELASIYHFPYGAITTEGMVRSHSRTLPASLAIKNGEFDVVFGRNQHHGDTTAIGLTAAERERHTYILGGTGNGKSTMMLYAIIQDIWNGKGVAVIDPHGDLARDLLKYIPEERIDDVVYFRPRDLDYPIGLNLLELPEGLSGSELEHEKDRVTESVVSVLRKLFSEDDTGGHRIEYVLRNTIHTAMTVEDATIFTVLKLLTNAKYRKSVVKKLEDDYLIDFWNEEMGKAGDMQAVKMSSGVTNKIGRFRSSASALRTLGQVKSTIDFDDIINSGKILICNFSKGALGEDTSSLFGTTILAKLYLSALRREEMEQQDRRPFYVYVDEFQNFATTLFLDLLTQARKYKLLLTMAEQSTSQQEDQRMVETILNNVGTLICFRTGTADERLILPRFKPYLEPGEFTNLPTYSFYAKLSAVTSQEPVSGETILPDIDSSDEVAKRVIGASRVRYAKKYEETKPRSSYSNNATIPKKRK